MFREAAAEAAPGRRRRAGSTRPAPCARPTSTSSRPASSRWRPPASSGRCSCSSRRASPPTPDGDRLPGLAAAHVRRLRAGGGAAPRDVERPGARHRGAAGRLRRGLGAHRRAEVPLLDPPELERRAGASRQRPRWTASPTCASTAATPPSGGVTPRRRIATTTSTRARNWRRSARRRRASRRGAEEGLSLLQQPLLGAGRGQRRAAAPAARQPVPAPLPPALVERFPVARRAVYLTVMRTMRSSASDLLARRPCR